MNSLVLVAIVVTGLWQIWAVLVEDARGEKSLTPTALLQLEWMLAYWMKS